MTTTAFDDQFAVGTQTVERIRAPYDPIAILKRNVADLELALKQQTELKEKAEEKLTTAREDMQSWIDSRNGWMERAGAAEAELARLAKQKPDLYMSFSDCGNFIRYWTRDTKNLEATMAVNDFEVLEFYASPVPAPAVPELDPMTRLIVSDPKQLKPKKQEPAVPYGIDEEAANRIALAVYDCKHGINQEPLLYAINRILATEAHPLSAEGQRSLLQSAEGSNAAADRLMEGGV